MGAKEKEKLIKLLKLLRDKYKKTIILITKDTDFCYQVTDKVFVIDRGRVVLTGDRKSLENDKMLTFYDLETPNIVKFINACNKKNKKVLIYGTGKLFKLVSENYDLKSLDIIGLCDNKYLIDEFGQIENNYKIKELIK